MKKVQKKNMKKNAKKSRSSFPVWAIAALICAAVLCIVLLPKNSPESAGASGIGKYYARIAVKDYGEITLELDGDTAPLTVQNFVKLAEDGFYDGLTFHRIISGFMIQGGDPLGNGTGGSENKIKGEFSQNGVKNDISHVRGTISMARSSLPDSASSQFFIMHEDGTYLDGSYAGFGHVLSGMETVDAICAAVPVQDGNGTVAKADQPVIESIRIITAAEAGL